MLRSHVTVSSNNEQQVAALHFATLRLNAGPKAWVKIVLMFSLHDEHHNEHHTRKWVFLGRGNTTSPHVQNTAAHPGTPDVHKPSDRPTWWHLIARLPKGQTGKQHDCHFAEQLIHNPILEQCGHPVATRRLEVNGSLSVGECL